MRSAPTSTYRLQLRPGFGFAEAAAVVPYLSSLGVSHLYLSPILQAVPGSAHGYDVVDHTLISADLGGEDALRSLADVAHDHGIGVVVDVVPNHMAVPVPATLNAKLWSVLRDGPHSPYARWFDVDWESSPDRALLIPVLARRIGQVLDAGEITRDELDGEPVLRYYERVFPVRVGTEDLPLGELVQQQWYRLAHWRLGDEELNYRRFFDVETLAAVRVELPEVFAATHDLLVRLYHDGILDGFRIDHPDGLADPRGYLRALHSATDGAWVVVEKILEGEEELPDDWDCAGTTGYDALNRVLHLFVDPEAEAPLRSLWSSLTGDPRDLSEVAEESKRFVLETSLRAELTRLVDLAVAVGATDLSLRDFTRRRLTSGLVELLVAFDRYRAYVVPGEPPSAEAVAVMTAAAQRAAGRREDLTDEIALLTDLALGRLGRDAVRDEFCVRFQQTCGPVMAKGVEDTAYYRWLPLAALAEVGGWPAPMGWIPESPPEAPAPDGLHRWAARQQELAALGLTTLSTHDTKRSEDTRTRIAALSEDLDGWRRAVTAWRAAAGPYRDPELDAATEYLLWQTLVGTSGSDGLISAERLAAYAEKATREAKVHTSWTDPNAAYDRAVRGFVEGVLQDPAIRNSVAAFAERLAPAVRVATLGSKLMQLTLPGVADVYQGCEGVSLRLVDPDNRGPVDHDGLRRTLDRLDGGAAPADLHEEKLLVTSRALRLRRERPDLFGPGGSYAPQPSGSPYVLAFLRGGAALVAVTRLHERLARDGGLGNAVLRLPPGRWRDRLTGRTYEGPIGWSDLLDSLPVALLARS